MSPLGLSPSRPKFQLSLETSFVMGVPSRSHTSRSSSFIGDIEAIDTADLDAAAEELNDMEDAFEAWAVSWLSGPLVV